MTGLLSGVACTIGSSAFGPDRLTSSVYGSMTLIAAALGTEDDFIIHVPAVFSVNVRVHDQLTSSAVNSLPNSLFTPLRSLNVNFLPSAEVSHDSARRASSGASNCGMPTPSLPRWNLYDVRYS